MQCQFFQFYQMIYNWHIGFCVLLKNKRSVCDNHAQIDMILVDLAQAKKVIPEFGTIVMLILSIAIISIIGLTTKSRLSIKV